MANLSCTSIHKTFGTTKVLDDVSIEVETGKFLVILGPSGCGKSTLLRIIAGIETQDSGSVQIDGEAIDNVHPRHRNVAMVFQNYALYPLMTVFDNMAFSLRIQKTSEDDIKKRVHEVAEIIGIADQLEKRPAQLSGGQRQRVAMGRAMVRNPRVFLFDEPLSNLDARLRAKMRGEIKQLHLTLNTTTVYVTHDQIEAMTMGDHIVVMRNSVVEQRGTPDEIYSQPINLHVATFIGSPEINVIKTANSGGNYNLGQHNLPLPKSISNKEIYYCVRPHDLELVDVSGDEILPAKVEFVEPTGSYSLVHAIIDNTTLLMQTPPDKASNLKVGDEIKIRFNPEKIHMFDGESEEAIK